jgi:hypothetical protein
LVCAAWALSPESASFCSQGVRMAGVLPHLADQPDVYPVLNKQYAIRIAP